MEWVLAVCLAMIGGIYGVLWQESHSKKAFSGNQEPRLANWCETVPPAAQARNRAGAEAVDALRAAKLLPTLRTRKGNAGSWSMVDSMSRFGTGFAGGRRL